LSSYDYGFRNAHHARRKFDFDVLPIYCVSIKRKIFKDEKGKRFPSK
jgi:hypothetical protein